ncbi:hypothetical protein INT45_012632 [Circinella minor]|uniref:Uncharacterized protein n=1 Tax=Circinella minor TaxID=1195481 RepID=A0A8H7V7V8_9FUNG|nr:hypothetical protein INT45_012632 [Circinella minor]
MDQINLLTFIAIMAEFVPILGITLTLLIERAKHLAENHQHIESDLLVTQLRSELEKDLKKAKVDKTTKDASRNNIIGRIRSFVRFLKSSNPHFSDAMLDGNTSSAATSQGDKEFRFQNTKGLFTYICEKHVHIWIQMDEEFDTKTACKLFTIDGVTPNMKPGGSPQKAISYYMKGMDYVCYNMDPNYEIKTHKMHQQLLEYQLITKQLNMRKATEIYPELLWKYDTVKSNLNSYFHDANMENNLGNKLDIWSI